MDQGQNFTIKNTFCGFLAGHTGAVSSIVTGHSSGDGKNNNILISGSRDKTLLIWKLNTDLERNTTESFGDPYIALTGHNNFVSDLSLSTDNNFLISSSWDNSLRLWNLKSGKCIKRFSVNDKNSILSATFANDNRQIFSCGTDNKVSLWNTQGKLMMSSTTGNHLDWISKVRNSPSAKNKFYATVGWDGRLKIWTDFLKIQTSIKAHEGPANALAINTNGLYIATGGKDQTVKLWKINELNEPVKVYKTDSPVNDVAFNPELQWVAAATDNLIYIWDISNDFDGPIQTIKAEPKKTKIQGEPKFTTLAWSSSGKYLFCGATDGLIRVQQIEISESS